MKHDDRICCPEGHPEVEARYDLSAPTGKVAYLCQKCLEVFYIDNPGIVLLGADTREYCENLDKPLISVRHADLVRSSPDSLYRSVCPACPDGALLVRRNPVNAQIEAVDVCVACAQTFVYTDIDQLRRPGGLP